MHIKKIQRSLGFRLGGHVSIHFRPNAVMLSTKQDTSDTHVGELLRQSEFVIFVRIAEDVARLPIKENTRNVTLVFQNC